MIHLLISGYVVNGRHTHMHIYSLTVIHTHINVLILIRFSNHSYMRDVPKVMILFISMETIADTSSKITPLDRASFYLQNTIFPHINYYWLCIFTSNEQKAECCSHKNLHKWRLPIFLVMTAFSRKCLHNPIFISSNK